MATLKALNAAPEQSVIRFVGQSVKTALTSSEGIPYYTWKLAKPVKVYCSTEALIEPKIVDELYIRETDIDSDAWEKDADGFFAVVRSKDKDGKDVVKEFVADFSINREISLYQDSTIFQWRNGARKDRTKERRTSLIDKINKGGGKS